MLLAVAAAACVAAAAIGAPTACPAAARGAAVSALPLFVIRRWIRCCTLTAAGLYLPPCQRCLWGLLSSAAGCSRGAAVVLPHTSAVTCNQHAHFVTWWIARLSGEAAAQHRLQCLTHMVQLQDDAVPKSELLLNS